MLWVFWIFNFLFGLNEILKFYQMTVIEIMQREFITDENLKINFCFWIFLLYNFLKLYLTKMVWVSFKYLFIYFFSLILLCQIFMKYFLLICRPFQEADLLVASYRILNWTEEWKSDVCIHTNSDGLKN